MEFLLLLRLALLVALALFAHTPRSVQADEPLFNEELGVAIGGFDTVAFFAEGRAIQGHASHAVMWKGVVWHFVSEENQYSFESNPRAFAPVFGGYCAYSVSQGYLMSGNPHSWQIVDGQLYLLYNPAVQDIWRKEMTVLIDQAHGNWPNVLRRE